MGKSRFCQHLRYMIAETTLSASLKVKPKPEHNGQANAAETGPGIAHGDHDGGVRFAEATTSIPEPPPPPPPPSLPTVPVLISTQSLARILRMRRRDAKSGGTSGTSGTSDTSRGNEEEAASGSGTATAVDATTLQSLLLELTENDGLANLLRNAIPTPATTSTSAVTSTRAVEVQGEAGAGPGAEAQAGAPPSSRPRSGPRSVVSFSSDDVAPKRIGLARRATSMSGSIFGGGGGMVDEKIEPSL